MAALERTATPEEEMKLLVKTSKYDTAKQHLALVDDLEKRVPCRRNG